MDRKMVAKELVKLAKSLIGTQYKSQAARDAQKQGYGDKKYWDDLDKSAKEDFKYYMAKGDKEKAKEMLTRSLTDALKGNEGD